MAVIAPCTMSAAGARPRAQPPAQVAMAALGVLALFGGIGALALDKLPNRYSLALVSGGGVAALAACFLWPNRASGVDLGPLVEGLDEGVDVELAAQVERLSVAELRGLREWNAEVFARLIEGCPNLKEVDLEGFGTLVGTDEPSARVVIEALARSSVEVIRAGDERAFVAPDLPKGVLNNAVRDYLPRLTVFEGRWAEWGKVSEALAMMRAMPHLERFEGARLTVIDTDIRALLGELYRRLEPDQIVLNCNIDAEVHRQISKELESRALSAPFVTYLRAEGQINKSLWTEIDTQEKWDKLQELLPDLQLS